MHAELNACMWKLLGACMRELLGACLTVFALPDNGPLLA